jgi:hypothetical protein
LKSRRNRTDGADETYETGQLKSGYPAATFAS